MTARTRHNCDKHAAEHLRVKEWSPTYTLDRQIAQARSRMGEARWAELSKEWMA